MTPRQANDLHALRVLRAIVDVEDRGDDPYDAADAIAEQLELSPEALEACLTRLVTGGHVYGGAYFSGPFVEGTTERGRRVVAKWRAIRSALDHVLGELDGLVEHGEWHEAGSRAWSQATWIRESDVSTDLDIIEGLIDRDRDDDT